MWLSLVKKHALVTQRSWYEQSLSVVIHFADAEVANSAGPRLAVGSYSGVKVSNHKKAFFRRSVFGFSHKILEITSPEVQSVGA